MKEISRNITDLGGGQRVEVVVYADGQVVVRNADKVLVEHRYWEATRMLCFMSDRSKTEDEHRIEIEIEASNSYGQVRVGLRCDDRYDHHDAPQLSLRVPFHAIPEERKLVVSARRGDSDPNPIILFEEPYHKKAAA